MELKAGSCFIWSIVQVLHSLESKRLLDLFFAEIRVSLVCALTVSPRKRLPYVVPSVTTLILLFRYLGNLMWSVFV